MGLLLPALLLHLRAALLPRDTEECMLQAPDSITEGRTSSLWWVGVAPLPTLVASLPGEVWVLGPNVHLSLAW